MVQSGALVLWDPHCIRIPKFEDGGWKEFLCIIEGEGFGGEEGERSKREGDKTKQEWRSGVGGLSALAKNFCPRHWAIPNTNPTLGQVDSLWTLEMGNSEGQRRWVRRQRRPREHWLFAN